MDFLFAPLPDTNFQMTDDQLVLWQRNAIFESECDNFINRQIESGRITCQGLRQQPNWIRRPLVEQSAIDMAIEQHGLHAMGANVSAPQRPRLVPAVIAVRHSAERENGLDFYQEAIAAVIRERGLGLQRNP